MQLLEPEHDLAQVVTLGSSSAFPSAQSVALTQAPADTPHVPASSAGGTDASLAPPAPPEPAAPAEPVDELVVVEPDELAELTALVEPATPPLVVEALVPPPGVSLLPPHATSAAPKSHDKRFPPDHPLDIAMLLRRLPRMDRESVCVVPPGTV